VAGLGWYPCGRLKHITDTTPTSHTETPTHIERRTHKQCGDTIEKSQAPDDGCINVRNMLSIEEVNFFPNAPTCPCGLPSWAWQKCNRLLSLGRHEARLRCPDDVSSDIGGCSARRALKPKFY